MFFLLGFILLVLFSPALVMAVDWFIEKILSL